MSFCIIDGIVLTCSKNVAFLHSGNDSFKKCECYWRWVVTKNDWRFESELTLSWQRSLSYRSQSIDLLYKSMDWFLYARDLCHERIKNRINSNLIFKLKSLVTHLSLLTGKAFDKCFAIGKRKVFLKKDRSKAEVITDYGKNKGTSNNKFRVINCLNKITKSYWSIPKISSWFFLLSYCY